MQAQFLSLREAVCVLKSQKNPLCMDEPTLHYVLRQLQAQEACFFSEWKHGSKKDSRKFVAHLRHACTCRELSLAGKQSSDPSQTRWCPGSFPPKTKKNCLGLSLFKYAGVAKKALINFDKLSKVSKMYVLKSHVLSKPVNQWMCYFVQLLKTKIPV